MGYVVPGAPDGVNVWTAVSTSRSSPVTHQFSTRQVSSPCHSTVKAGTNALLVVFRRNVRVWVPCMVRPLQSPGLIESSAHTSASEQ